MNKLGIMVPSLGPNQLAQSIILSGVELFEAGSPLDVVAFYQQAALPQMEPPFACMNATEAFDYDGPMIATTLSTAEALLKCPGPSARYFYAWDLEWMRRPGRTYGEMARVYRGLPLIARGEEHRGILEDLWHADVCGVVADADLSALSAITKG